MLCKCGWDFDHFDQFDQKHAFSNHNPKRMTIDFDLRELLTIIKHCKNEKQNEWSWNFISFLVCFHHCRKENKEKIVKFIFILQQTTSIHSHSFNIIKPITINHNQTTMRMRRGKGENEHHQPSNKSKPHRLTRAWREGENKLHSPNYPLFQHSVSAMNTRSPPMRIDTPQVIRADRDLSHWCFRRLYPIQQSNEWVWRAWQEEVSN